MHFDPRHTYFMASTEHLLRVRDVDRGAPLTRRRKTRRRVIAD